MDDHIPGNKAQNRVKELLYMDLSSWIAMFIDGYRLSSMRQQNTVEFYKGADKSLARPGRKEAAFSAFYGTWRFITIFTRAHHLSIPQPSLATTPGAHPSRVFIPP